MADTFRKTYTVLTDDQKSEMEAIQIKAEELEALMLASKTREPRLMSVALTDLEKSVAMAVKAVTTAEL